jgi:ADP-heptose:LPS heptosyltransferase
MSLETLAPLANEAVTFLSVQKGDRAEDAATPPAGMNLVNLSPEISDFEDTAAIITIADLLISVDSSPVHLAGGLGRPAWVMLPKLPDWRWLLDRNDTPWYPSVRLFRQATHENWNNVVHEMANELAKLRP